MDDAGAPATWLEPMGLSARRKGAAWRVGIGLALALGIWAVQLANDALDFSRSWVGLIPLCWCLALAIGTYRTPHVRRYAKTTVVYSKRQRLKRAGKWWASGLIGLAIVWGSLLNNDHFATGWWLAAVTLPLFAVGVGLYLLKAETSLTPAAALAYKHFAEGHREPGAPPPPPSEVERLLQAPLVRYGLAAALLYAAYYFVNLESKNSGWAALSCVVFAAFCAHELSKWVLLFAGAGLAIWAVSAGIAALPVSAAIIIGALIIASALSR